MIKSYIQMTFDKHDWQSIANDYNERLLSCKTIYDTSTITKNQPFSQAKTKYLRHMHDMAYQDCFSVTNYDHYAGTIEDGISVKSWVCGCGVCFRRISPTRGWCR